MQEHGLLFPEQRFPRNVNYAMLVAGHQFLVYLWHHSAYYVQQALHHRYQEHHRPRNV